MDADMKNLSLKEAIEILRINAEFVDAEFEDAINLAIAALEFRKHYNEFWADVKSAGMKGKAVEIHHGGRVFRLREVTQ